MSVLRFTSILTSVFTSLLSSPGRLFVPALFLYFSTSLIGAVPLVYLLVPLLLVFLMLSMLVLVEVIRDTAVHTAVAAPPARVEPAPVVRCQMLRSGRCACGERGSSPGEHQA